MKDIPNFNWLIVTILNILALLIYLSGTPYHRKKALIIVIDVLCILQFFALWIVWGNNKRGIKISTWAVISAMFTFVAFFVISLELTLHTFNTKMEEDKDQQQVKIKRQNALITMILIMQIVSFIGRMLVYYERKREQ